MTLQHHEPLSVHAALLLGREALLTADGPRCRKSQSICYCQPGLLTPGAAHPEWHAIKSKFKSPASDRGCQGHPCATGTQQPGELWGMLGFEGVNWPWLPGMARLSSWLAAHGVPVTTTRPSPLVSQSLGVPWDYSPYTTPGLSRLGCLLPAQRRARAAPDPAPSWPQVQISLSLGLFLEPRLETSRAQARSWGGCGAPARGQRSLRGGRVEEQRLLQPPALPGPGGSSRGEAWRRGPPCPKAALGVTQPPPPPRQPLPAPSLDTREHRQER